MKDELSRLITRHSFKTCQPAPPLRAAFMPAAFPRRLPRHVSSLFASIYISPCLAAPFSCRKLTDNFSSSSSGGGELMTAGCGFGSG